VIRRVRLLLMVRAVLLGTIVLIGVASPRGLGTDVVWHSVWFAVSVIGWWHWHRNRHLVDPVVTGWAVVACDVAFVAAHAYVFQGQQGASSAVALLAIAEAGAVLPLLGAVAAGMSVGLVANAWPIPDNSGAKLSALVVWALVVGLPLITWSVARVVARANERGSALGHAFAHVVAPVLVIDEGGLIAVANPAAAAVAGCTAPAALVGTSLERLAHPDDRLALRRCLVFSEAADPAQAGAVRATRDLRLGAPGQWRWHRVAVSRAPGLRGRFIAHLIDVHERVVAEQRLVVQAEQDSLTGLMNRDRLLADVARALERGPVALLFVDLDGFKWVNDAHGHAEGDRLLVTVAERLSGVTRHGELVARLGGDEFGLLVPDATANIGLGAADRVLEALRALVQVAGFGPVHVRASIGVAVSDPGLTPLDLLRDADTAMYRAKRLGGDRAELFTPSMRVQARRRHDLEQQMFAALADSAGISLAYQPVYDVRTRELCGFEALARWNHERFGQVPPSEFVPIAEASGLIHDLGDWAMRTALTEAATWPRRADGTPLEIAVNVSWLQLAAEGFPARLARIVDESGVDPRSVWVEVTETALTDSLPAVTDALHQVRRLGVRVAIDDFGTGHASLTHLITLPVDAVKVDRSFVTDSRPGGRGVVVAIAAMAASLGLDVVAEGVERQEQLEAVAAAGIHRIQGYLLSMPLVVDRVRQVVQPASAPRPVAVAEQRRPVRALPAAYSAVPPAVRRAAAE
jgi:diguanylate cyclase (GGDEF)-like protein/PAS domain S-box-containing protein